MCAPACLPARCRPRHSAAPRPRQQPRGRRQRLPADIHRSQRCCDCVVGGSERVLVAPGAVDALPAAGQFGAGCSRGRAGKRGSTFSRRCLNHRTPSAWCLNEKYAAWAAAGRSLEWPHLHLFAWPCARLAMAASHSSAGAPCSARIALCFFRTPRDTEGQTSHNQMEGLHIMRCVGAAPTPCKHAAAAAAAEMGGGTRWRWQGAAHLSSTPALANAHLRTPPRPSAPAGGARLQHLAAGALPSDAPCLLRRISSEGGLRGTHAEAQTLHAPF